MATNPPKTPVAKTTTPAATPPQIHPPKSPPGHPIPDPELRSSLKNREAQESPLFRRSLIGRRPESPSDNGGVPMSMRIPHGFENPSMRKEKGEDGLMQLVYSDFTRSAKKERFGGDEVGDVAVTDDDDSAWIDEDDVRAGPKVILDHTILSSPVIRLILDHTDSTNHTERVTFMVHKALLGISDLLSACLGSDTPEIILNGQLKPYAVSAVVQFLYSGDFTLDDKFNTFEDGESYFQKLANLEYTCCHLGVAAARRLALERIEQAYEEFEFRINAEGMRMRVEMTEWAYMVDEAYIKPGGKIQRLRIRILAGWCRDISLIHQDNKLNETFENLTVDYPTFGFDLRQFLEERVKEDPKLQRKLDAFEKAEEAGWARFERKKAFLFPNIHPSRARLPTLSVTETQTGGEAQRQSAVYSPNVVVGDKENPPQRKRAARVSDISEKIGVIQSSKPKF
ncbi:hypothetical protein TWF694_002091 [Orbilia ellipsospora]|uniref:BTB domain-containing protein n=1 Tax=Orbilia ellipsospora TaxID=2528407 RepID=A0AAV9X4I9_9PEZI